MASAITSLICSSCDGPARGRQWHNCDTGFGLCEKCAARIKASTNAAKMRSRYGIEGVHYNVASPHSERLQRDYLKRFDRNVLGG